MQPVQGAATFQTTGAAYDGFMGRYSRPLAVVFADAAGVTAGKVALDVGCGPGALTEVLIDRLGVDDVWACDPSPPFVAVCAARHPGLDVRRARAEELPYEDGSVDVALTQLVLHFVSDPEAAARELRRVTRPGGTVAACVWDFADGMEMLRAFWDAALEVDPAAPDEARTLRFGGEGEIAALFEGVGLTAIAESTLRVSTTYADFEELWTGFLAGIGPAGAWCVGLDEVDRAGLRGALFRHVGEPAGAFELSALARCCTARVPA